MNNMNSKEWIAQFLASEPPRSKSLVVTIFGDSIVPHGGTVWLGSLIELLAPFGVNDRLLRTSVFRLAQEGWLGAQRDGRRSAYAITPEAMGRFALAYRRIYAPLELHWDGKWTLVMSPAGNIDAAARGALRKQLLWEGYSLIAPGVFGHPAGDAAVLEQLLVRTGLRGKVYVCQASELDGVSRRPLGELVRDGWDLTEVVSAYERFMAQFQPLLALLQGEPIAPRQAFVVRTLMIHAYRRIQLHDPQLPIELLPDPWPGAKAYELARQLYRLSYASAEQYIVATLRVEDERASEAEAAFHQRFGGLA